MSALARFAFRRLLVLFPRWFRARYEEDMLENFDGRLHHIRRTSGRWAALIFVVRSCLEVVPSAVATRAGRSDGRRDGIGEIVDDAAIAWKSLRRAPGWTGAALLILTLGIGGTAAVFSVLNAVLLRALPYEDPDRLAVVWTMDQARNQRDGSSWENSVDWRDRSRSVDEVAVYFRPEFTTATVSSFGEPERLHVGLVSPNFFEMLGVPAVHGRVFGPSDLTDDPRLVVIGAALWNQRYGGDPDVLSQSITIDGSDYSIVGVIPADVGIPLEETVIWQLHDVRPPDDRDWRGYDAYVTVARLSADATLADARAELTRIAADLAVEYPDSNRDLGVTVHSLRTEIVGDRLPLLLWTLFGSMVLVLLVGGINVAQLMLSRSIDRRRELAVRSALGASRARVNRQLFAESLWLSLLAGLGGVLLAWVGTRGLVALLPPDVPLTDDVSIDGAVLALGFVVAAVLSPIVGLLPAMSASRRDSAGVLRSGGRGATAGDRRLRAGLVVAEVAMAVVLLAGAGLLLRSAMLLQATDPGFDARGTLVARVDLPRPGENEDVAATLERLRRDVSAHPAILDVGMIGRLFVERIPDMTINVVGGAPRDPERPPPRLTADFVFPGFFPAIGLPVLQGRGFERSDLGADDEVVVVNRAWVRAFADDRPPIGLQFRWGDQVEGDVLTVVGVVSDLRRTTLDEPSYPQMFLAGATTSLDVVIRTSGDPRDAAAPLQDAVRDLDRRAAVSGVSTAWERFDVGLAPRQFQTLLFSIFAALATLLAAIGLFAVMHDSVASRRREIGVRIALGAAPSGVRAMVFAQGLRLAALGLVLGLGATLGVSSVLRGLVYGIGATDPLTLGAVSVTLLVVAAAASALPAVAATRVPPSESLTGDG